MLVNHYYPFKGGELSCMVDITPGEPSITTGPPENWHPGARATAFCVSASLGDTNIYELLRDTVIDDIEEKALRAYEDHGGGK